MLDLTLGWVRKQIHSRKLGNMRVLTVLALLLAVLALAQGSRPLGADGHPGEAFEAQLCYIGTPQQQPVL